MYKKSVCALQTSSISARSYQDMLFSFSFSSLLVFATLSARLCAAVPEEEEEMRRRGEGKRVSDETSSLDELDARLATSEALLQEELARRKVSI